MNILGPTRHPRLNEGIGFVFLALGIGIILSLISYHPTDLSWNTVGTAAKPLNLIGRAGAHAADLLLQLGRVGSVHRPRASCSRSPGNGFVRRRSRRRTSSSSELALSSSELAPRFRLDRSGGRSAGRSPLADWSAHCWRITCSPTSTRSARSSLLPSRSFFLFTSSRAFPWQSSRRGLPARSRLLRRIETGSKAGVTFAARRSLRRPVHALGKRKKASAEEGASSAPAARAGAAPIHASHSAVACGWLHRPSGISPDRPKRA